MDLKLLDSKNESLSQCVINYKQCVLCQTVKKSRNNIKTPLIDPFKKKGLQISESYDLIVSILKVRFIVI